MANTAESTPTYNSDTKDYNEGSIVDSQAELGSNVHPAGVLHENDKDGDIFSMVRHHCVLLHQNHKSLADVINGRYLSMEVSKKLGQWFKNTRVEIKKICGQMWEHEELDRIFDSFTTKEGLFFFAPQNIQKCDAYVQLMVWSSLDEACHSSIVNSLEIMTNTMGHHSDQASEDQMWGWFCACTSAVKATVMYVTDIMEKKETLSANSGRFCVSYVLSSLAVPRTIEYFARVAEVFEASSFAEVLANVQTMDPSGRPPLSASKAKSGQTDRMIRKAIC